jgi:hypothetical protein
MPVEICHDKVEADTCPDHEGGVVEGSLFRSRSTPTYNCLQVLGRLPSTSKYVQSWAEGS